MAKEPGYFTFIKNDGTSTSTSITAKYDTMTAPSISNIAGVDWTRSNYNFVEWNTDSNGTGASCSPGDTIDWDTYGVCYAIWEEKHEVTIYYKGSTIAGMDASGTKTLNTEGTWVEADISVEYDRPTAPTPVYQSKTVNPSTSSQTVSADTGYDALSDVTVTAMPSGTAGTPTATKGTVSNHSIAVTPSVTNTTGYITGGTINGTAVTVSASELVSGTYWINQSGSQDVTNYASININSGSASTPATTITPTINFGLDSSDGTIMADVSGSKYITPTVISGYIASGSGTSGKITVSGYNTWQLPLYGGEHHHPNTVTISLTNPIIWNVDLDTCEIYEAENSTDYYNENKIGEITSSTGSTTVTVSSSLYGIVIYPSVSGGYASYQSSNVSCTGGTTLANLYDGHAVIAISDSGTVTIDGIEYLEYE